MKFQLNKNAHEEDFLDFSIERLLLLNGIESPKEYLSFNEEYDYNKLTNIDKAVALFDKYVDKEEDINIAILSDKDEDGISSSSIMYQYIKQNIQQDKRIWSSDIYILPIILEGKKHGLNEEVYDFIKSNGIDLLIVPDAQCDYEMSKNIVEELDCAILVLDHHKTDTNEMYKHENMVIVNPNQTIDTYPNKDLSGCAVTYKFIQALDDYYFTDCAEQFIDLVAISIIADSMSLKSYENRYLVTKGLQNIKNPFIQSMIKAQSFSLNGKEDLDPVDYSFYIIPPINAMIRIGSKEDNEVLFKAFCGEYCEYPYKKNKKTETVQEDVFTRATRLCKNAHARQNKIREKDTNLVENIIKKNSLENDNIIMVYTNEINKNLSGLTAMKIASKYDRPVCILRDYKEDENLLGGSARNINNSFIENLKDYLWNSGLVILVEGHQGACGVQIPKDNISKLIERANNEFTINTSEKCYVVDYIIDLDDITVDTFIQLEKFQPFIANDIKEPLFLCTLDINTNECESMGKNRDTWKCKYGDDIQIIKFSSKEDIILDKINNLENSKLTIKAVVSLKFNNYNGILTPQIVIKDYNILECEDIEEDDEWSDW